MPIKHAYILPMEIKISFSKIERSFLPFEGFPLAPYAKGYTCFEIEIQVFKIHV